MQSPTPFGLGRNGCWPSPGSQLPWASPHTTIFLLCCPLNDSRTAAHRFFKIGRLSSLFLFSCSSLARLCLLILLFLLMSGNVHPNPGLIFNRLVCAENVTLPGKSVQCCSCSKWVHLRYSQLSFSKFRTLRSSHSWSCRPCCVPTRNTVTPSSDSSDMYISTVQFSPPLLMLHSRPILVFKPLIPRLPILHLLPLPPHHRPLLLAVLLRLLPLLSPDSLMVLQWNAGGLRARSTELLHFLSSHPVDLICIQESNLNSSSFFRIVGFIALRSDRTHSRSDILSRDAMQASDGVIIFVRQGLSFSELPPLFLSTSSLSSLDPYSDYVGVNISLNNSSSLSFFNVYALPIRSSPTDGRTDSFSHSIFPSSTNLFILGNFNCHHLFSDSRGTSKPRREEVCDWVISSDLLPINDSDIPTLKYSRHSLYVECNDISTRSIFFSTIYSSNLTFRSP